MARILAYTCDNELVKGRIEPARGKTCIEVRRAAEAAEDRQMRARRVLRLRVPLRVDALLRAAFRAARRLADHWLGPEECLLRMAEHFIETWKDLPRGKGTPELRAVEGDRGLCQVPGCSRAAVHAHHVLYRARRGGDEPENLVALCAALAELLLEKGYEVHGMVRRSSSFNTGRIDHIYQDPHTRGPASSSTTATSTTPRA